MSQTQLANHLVVTKKTQVKYGYIFVLQLHNGQLVIGQASNPCRRIAAINSGMNRAIQESLQINKIIGVKEITRTKNLMTVVKKFCDRYGSERIITV